MFVGVGHSVGPVGYTYLGVGKGSFRLSCLIVLPMVLSGILGSFVDMSGVILLHIFRLLDLEVISGFCPLHVCLSICLCLVL